MRAQMLSSRGPTISGGEQNLDGEPSWIAGGLQAPTIDYGPTSQSNALVSSKLSFKFPKPDPHEFVKRTVERLLNKLGVARRSTLRRPFSADSREEIGLEA